MAIETNGRGGKAGMGKLFQLEDVAHRVEPRVSWDDLALPEAKLSQMKDLCNRTREKRKASVKWGFTRSLPQGKGLNVLFSGASGSGKTMTAEAMGIRKSRRL